MSSYESYDVTSKDYDETRQPVGVPVILGCLALGPRPLAEMTVLDAGCGTGNYSRALLAHVGRVEAVDLSSGMIAQAAAKLAAEKEAGRVTFHVSSIAEPPLDGASVDGVMTNQALHHLGDDPAAGYPLHRRAVEEFHRVLRPGGVLVVNTCSREQLDGAYWYFDLIPEAAARLTARYIPLDALVHLLGETGFEVGERIVPVDAVLQGESLFRPRGPLDERWRNGDSTWSLATPEELERALRRVREMDEMGILEDYVARHDARRPLLGQTTFLYATRKG